MLIRLLSPSFGTCFNNRQKFKLKPKPPIGASKNRNECNFCFSALSSLGSVKIDDFHEFRQNMRFREKTPDKALSQLERAGSLISWLRVICTFFSGFGEYSEMHFGSSLGLV